MTGWTRSQQLSIRCDSSFAPAAVSPALAVKIEENSVVKEAVKKSKLRATSRAEEFPFAVERIKFQTCERLYRQQAKEGMKHLPTGGIELNVGYIDTGIPENVTAEARRDYPTVLCLHGAGGNHKDLAVVIKSLAAKGARVLAPNFPGHGDTPMDAGGVYTQTTIENCNFILDFLKALGVNRLDLLTAFSCGCYTAVPLASKSGLKVNGLALLQVPGHRPYRAVRPLWATKNMTSILRAPLVRQTFAPLALKFMKSLGFMHIPDLETPYIMALVATGTAFDGYRKMATELPFHRIPLAMTFSEDDRFMDTEISYEFANFVGLSPDRLTYINPQGQLEKPGNPIKRPDSYLKGVVFRKAGHYAQRKEKTATVLKETVADLYDHIVGNKDTIDAALAPFRVAKPQFKPIRVVEKKKN